MKKIIFWAFIIFGFSMGAWLFISWFEVLGKNLGGSYHLHNWNLFQIFLGEYL